MVHAASKPAMPNAMLDGSGITSCTWNAFTIQAFTPPWGSMLLIVTVISEEIGDTPENFT